MLETVFDDGALLVSIYLGKEYIHKIHKLKLNSHIILDCRLSCVYSLIISFLLIVFL